VKQDRTGVADKEVVEGALGLCPWIKKRKGGGRKRRYSYNGKSRLDGSARKNKQVMSKTRHDKG